MNNRSRFVPPLAAGLLLGSALALRFLWPMPEAGSSTRQPPPSVAVSTSTASEPAPVPSVTAAAKPEPVKLETQAQVGEGPRATVVPIGPGDVVPEPEVANPLPQENDPIEPEKPQTAAWRHEKMVRVTELLGRDVERLEQERKAAQTRGDETEARRLAVQLTRHQARLGKLREETEALKEAARQEEQAKAE
ncbi:hypothetical protein JRI60_03815 [Archangium violaceum]|uniref:hypothetical protein n=1 Tax=Archangium violaceum TaxID=83451 RepID=UPI00195146E0|nr:hypothetical protein [Archangium violaceum]QRN98207.1 hypothetical protein JRI60_03815 [Archangium violaceum]